MSEISEDFRAIREARQANGERRRSVASFDFEAAKRRCAYVGLGLYSHSEAHYSIRNFVKDWIINIYLGNGRIWVDPNKPRPPFLRLPRNWSLEDVVSAAILATRGS